MHRLELDAGATDAKKAAIHFCLIASVGGQ
jgi:hypothetical protein